MENKSNCKVTSRTQMRQYLISTENVVVGKVIERASIIIDSIRRYFLEQNKMSKECDVLSFQSYLFLYYSQGAKYI